MELGDLLINKEGKLLIKRNPDYLRKFALWIGGMINIGPEFR